jgi:hypothetical protein
MDVERLAWRTSSFSGDGVNGNGCVEVAPLPDGVAVRDTKDRSRAAHVYPSTTWESLLTDVRTNYPASK